jgi:hypothetical protein
MARALKSLRIEHSHDPDVNRLSLVWADGQEDTLDFASNAELLKKYLELKDLVPDRKSV